MVNLAYIGTGNITDFHLPALRKAGFNISSISSRKDSKNIFKSAEKFNIKNVIPDWHDLFGMTNSFDAIVLAVTIDVTFEILNKLMELNKPILVEKPVSFKPKDFDELLKKNNKKVFVAYNRRYYSSTSLAKKFVASKSNISASFFIPERNQLAFYQNSCHMIDLMSYFFEELPSTVCLLNIQDARHPDQKADQQFHQFLKHSPHDTFVTFNKIDKFKKQKERAALNKKKKELFEKYKWVKQIHFVSAEAGTGLAQLEQAVLSFCLEELQRKQIEN